MSAGPLKTGPPAAGPSTAAQPGFEIVTSSNLLGWITGEQLSLAFTTYQNVKLFLLGLQPGGRLSVFERPKTAAGCQKTPVRKKR